MKQAGYVTNDPRPSCFDTGQGLGDGGQAITPGVLVVPSGALPAEAKLPAANVATTATAVLLTRFHVLPCA